MVTVGLLKRSRQELESKKSVELTFTERNYLIAYWIYLGIQPLCNTVTPLLRGTLSNIRIIASLDYDVAADKCESIFIQIFVVGSEQEAQLPLRNRASPMHFFVAKLLSIAVMIYSYVCHLRSLRPANLLRTQRINFSMRPQHVRMTRDPTVV